MEKVLCTMVLVLWLHAPQSYNIHGVVNKRRYKNTQYEENMNSFTVVNFDGARCREEMTHTDLSDLLCCSRDMTQSKFTQLTVLSSLTDQGETDIS